MKITEQDKKQIAEAVEQAESTTSGEIVPLIVHASDRYRHADLAGGIIGQAVALIAGMWLIPGFDYTYAIVLMVAGFAVGYLITRHAPFMKRMLLGKKAVSEEVYQRALQAFFEQGLANTRDRTGILIMVSLLEHRVQVIADKGINDKVPKAAWDQVVQDVLQGIKRGSLIEGLEKAVRHCGEILSKDFPIKHDDTNELDNELIVE
jgi:putative membrane protein